MLVLTNTTEYIFKTYCVKCRSQQPSFASSVTGKTGRAFTIISNAASASLSFLGPFITPSNIRGIRGHQCKNTVLKVDKNEPLVKIGQSNAADRAKNHARGYPAV